MKHYKILVILLVSAFLFTGTSSAALFGFGSKNTVKKDDAKNQKTPAAATGAAAKPVVAKPVKAVQPANSQSASAQAAQEKLSKSVSEALKDMKNEDMSSEIKRMFDYSDQMLSAAPGFEIVKDAKGNKEYIYKDKAGKITKLEDLDRQALEDVYLKLRNTMIKLNNDRTTQQLKELKRIQDMERQRRALISISPNAKPYKAPPTLPKPYTAPKVYKAPAVPAKTYTAPKVYTAPKTYSTKR